MKKYLTLLLVLVLCLSFVACGESGQTQTTEKTDTTTASSQPDETTAPAGDETTAEVTTAEATTAEVTTAAPVAPENAIAQNGTEYYDSLETAFDLAADGSTIKLLKDIETDAALYPLTIGAVTFDGQGHTITANVTLMGFLNVDGFELTIKDLKVVYKEASESVENGKCGKAVVTVGNAGKVTLENCEFNSLWGDCLNIDAGGEMIIKSGKYTIDPTNNALQSNLICVNNASKLTVEDGTFSRVGTVENNRAMLRLNSSGPKVTINGGNWECACGRLVFLNGGVSINPDEVENEGLRVLTINGGNFTFGTDTYIETYKYTDGVFDMAGNGGVVAINGGTFEIKAGCPMPMFNTAGKNRIRITINDGTFYNATGSMFFAKTAKKETETEGVKTVTIGSEIVIAGGTFTNSDGKMFDDACLEECFTVTGGTFNCAAGEKDTVTKFVGTAATVK